MCYFVNTLLPLVDACPSFGGNLLAYRQAGNFGLGKYWEGDGRNRILFWKIKKPPHRYLGWVYDGRLGGVGSMVNRNLQLDETAELLAVWQGQGVFNWLIPVRAITLVLGDLESELPDTVQNRDLGIQSASGTARKLERDLTEKAVVDSIQEFTTGAVPPNVNGVNHNVARVAPVFDAILSGTACRQTLAYDICEAALAHVSRHHHVVERVIVSCYLHCIHVLLSFNFERLIQVISVEKVPMGRAI